MDFQSCVPFILLGGCNNTHESKESDANSGGILLNAEDVRPPLYTPEQINSLNNQVLPSSSGDDAEDAEQRRQNSERDYQMHKLENRMDELEREQQREEIDRRYDSQ